MLVGSFSPLTSSFPVVLCFLLDPSQKDKILPTYSAFNAFKTVPGSETVHGAESRQTKPECSSGVGHFVLSESVSGLESVHLPAALPNLDHAPGHNEGQPGPLRQHKGAPNSFSFTTPDNAHSLFV